jgi:hypothetical protein
LAIVRAQRPVETGPFVQAEGIPENHLALLRAHLAAPSYDARHAQTRAAIARAFCWSETCGAGALRSCTWQSAQSRPLAAQHFPHSAELLACAAGLRAEIGALVVMLGVLDSSPLGSFGRLGLSLSGAAMKPISASREQRANNG